MSDDCDRLFLDFYRKQIEHDRVHRRTGTSNLRDIDHDWSCNVCYPPVPQLISNNFDHFWEWYRAITPAQTYCIYSQVFFRNLPDIQVEDLWIPLYSLIFSIRYIYPPQISLETLKQEVWNAYCATDGFRLDPFQTIYAISEANSDEEHIEEIFDFTIEELNLETLFYQPETMANPTNADFQNLRNAIQALTQTLPQTTQSLQVVGNRLNANTNAIGNPPRREGRIADLPSFSGGNQDPVAWLREFEQACDANGIDDARKIQVVPAYLKGAASTWWTNNRLLALENANRIATWTGLANNNTEFDFNFLTTFRTQTLIKMWTTDLKN